MDTEHCPMSPREIAALVDLIIEVWNARDLPRFLSLLSEPEREARASTLHSRANPRGASELVLRLKESITHFFIFTPAFSAAAFIKPTNNGCGRIGLERNSGWNWLPTI